MRTLENYPFGELKWTSLDGKVWSFFHSFERLIPMHVHNVNNYLKSLGPTATEVQAALLAEQKNKKVNTDSEAAEKIRKFEDQVSGIKKKLEERPDSHSGGAAPEKDLGKETAGKKLKNPGSEDLPSPPVSSHIDIKV
jgi:hypothetical protein